MTTLNVSLPDTLGEFVQERIAQGGYNTADDYLRELIHEDQRRKAQEKLDSLLQAGLDSGPSTPMTTQDWADIRSEVRRRGAVQDVQKPAA
jgi:antitoxin ParD1/3/4